MLLPRPFKITKIGPVRLFVDDVGQAEAFYTERLGLTKSEESHYRGARWSSCAAAPSTTASRFIRRNCAAYASTCMSFGVELANYAQLRAAKDFLKSSGCTFVDIPPELYPGIDYSAFALDPDGHCIQLYYYMEQIGWVGPGMARWRKTGPRRLRQLCRSGLPGPVH